MKKLLKSIFKNNNSTKAFDVELEKLLGESRIYYAHHRWKYGTKIEEYELNLIKRYFPNARVLNPSMEIDVYGRSEEDIMVDCLEMVCDSDIVIFSSMDGMIGTGCYQEVTAAKKAGKLVLYLHQNKFHSDFHLTLNSREPKNDRIYAIVNF